MKHVVTEKEMLIVKECLRSRLASAKKNGSERISIQETGDKASRGKLEALFTRLTNGVVHQKNLFEVPQGSTRQIPAEITDETRKSVAQQIRYIIDTDSNFNLDDLFDYMNRRLAAMSEGSSKKAIVKRLIEEFSIGAGELAMVANSLTAFLGEP